MDTAVLLLRASRLKLALAVLAGTVSGLGVAALIALINTALALPRDRLPALLPVFGALCVMVFVARTLSESLLVRLSQQIIASLRGELARQILASQLRHLEQQGAHRLLAALTDDIAKIAALLTRLPTFCINCSVALGCFAYLGWLSWPLMLAALACVGLAIGGFCLAQGRAQQALEQSRMAGDDLYKHFIAITEGIKELQLHRGRRLAFLSGRLEMAISRVRQHFVAGMTIYAFAESIGLLVFFVFIGLLLFLPASLITLDQAVLTGYALTFLYLITPIEVLVSLAPEFGQFRIALKTIGDLQLSLQQACAEESDPESMGPLHTLELCGVTHAYRQEHDDSSFLLGPIYLAFKPGEVVFLTGGNGSGKTTLAKLLVGLYLSDNGFIRVNGHIVEQAQWERYRALFSSVFADFFLFEELLGIDDPQLEQKAGELLASLKLEHKVKLKNGRFSTISLSQGQRKRLALLVAVLEDRPFYLFDEWAADQDPVFKHVFYTEILPFLKANGKTVVAITHDDQYFHLADRHVKLEFGQIVTARPVTGHAPFMPARIEIPSL